MGGTRGVTPGTLGRQKRKIPQSRRRPIQGRHRARSKIILSSAKKKGGSRNKVPDKQEYEVVIQPEIINRDKQTPTQHKKGRAQALKISLLRLWFAPKLLQAVFRI